MTPSGEVACLSAVVQTPGEFNKALAKYEAMKGPTVVQSAGRVQLPERVSEEVRGSEDGNGHDADVQGPHAGVASERYGHGRFDGASIIGTAYTHAVR